MPSELPLSNAASSRTSPCVGTSVSAPTPATSPRSSPLERTRSSSSASAAAELVPIVTSLPVDALKLPRPPGAAMAGTRTLAPMMMVN